MQPLCTYPIAPEHVIPHIGARVCAVTLDGECHYGTIDNIADGNLYLRPFDGGPVGIQSVQKKWLLGHPKVTAAIKQAKVNGNTRRRSRHGKVSTRLGKPVKISAFFPWLVFPLLGLAALYSFPFFWW